MIKKILSLILFSSLSFSQSQIDIVVQQKYVLLTDGSVYEITSNVWYLNWYPNSFVDIIDDKKMIYLDKEYDIRKVKGSAYQVDEVFNNNYILLNDGSLYEITSYVGYKNWSSYPYLYIIEDKKMLYDGEEISVRKINNERFEKIGVRDVYDDRFIFLDYGKVYKFTSYVGYHYWSSYDEVYIIDDNKILYNGGEYTVDKINEENIERTRIKRVSDGYPYYISLVNGKTYYTIDLEPILWLDFSEVIIIEQDYMIYTSLDEIIGVTRVR